MVYWKCIIWAKSDLPMINSVREKVSFTINGPPNMQLFSFCLFHFSKFQMTIIKDFMEKPIEDFIIRFHGCYEVLLSHKYFWSTFFWQWNNDPFNFFFNFHGNASCFFIFAKWKKYYSLTFNDTFKMCGCAFC